MNKSDVSAQYKTKDCKKYAQTGYCPYGQRCQFIHGHKEQPPQQCNSPVPATQSAKDPSPFANLSSLMITPNSAKYQETHRKVALSPQGSTPTPPVSFFNLINFAPTQSSTKTLNQKSQKPKNGKIQIQ
jgi:hypothetical protein